MLEHALNQVFRGEPPEYSFLASKIREVLGSYLYEQARQRPGEPNQRRVEAVVLQRLRDQRHQFGLAELAGRQFLGRDVSCPENGATTDARTWRPDANSTAPRPVGRNTPQTRDCDGQASGCERVQSSACYSARELSMATNVSRLSIFDGFAPAGYG